MDFNQKFKQLLIVLIPAMIASPASAWWVREVRHTYVPVSTVTVVEQQPALEAVGCVLGAAAIGTVLGLGIGHAIDSRERKKEERRRDEEERARARQRRYEEERDYQRLREDDYMAQSRYEQSQTAQKRDVLQQELQEQAHQQRMKEMKLQAELNQYAEANQHKGVLSRFFGWLGSWFTWLW